MSEATASPPARRRRSAEDTRAAILAASRHVFAENGYDRATIRAIAAEAGCDPALVMRHFGSKTALFAEVADSPFESFPDAPPGKAGDLVAIAEALLERWHTDRTFLGLLRATASDPDAAELMRTFFEQRVRQHQPRVTGLPPDQAVCFGSMLVGLAYAREVTRIPPLCDMTSRQLAELMGTLIRPDAAAR